MMELVVVLPSEPVTAMVRQGHRRKKASISLVITAPCSRAETRCGSVGSRPGVRKMTSKPLRPSR